ncbi:MAG TPA: cysteine desulfurase [Longimicrobiales bacterium]|nr:cysteine desulfurase [Longimicrobiales bacterium]
MSESGLEGTRAGGATLAAERAAGRGPGPLDPVRVKERFPVFRADGPNAGLAYLDSAATAQRPDAVLDAVADFYRNDNANVHRGIYDLSRRATERFEASRRIVARFIGAPDPAEVIWTRGTTEAINLVAATWGAESIGPGDEIVLTMLEHHSNVVPWQLLAQRVGARLRYVDIDEHGRLRLDQLDELLKGRVKLVALNHVSNALGTINPVREAVERAHAAGALVLVDGAQAAPHLPVDVRALGCDFYALSAHKMGGSMGIGALWARRELLEAMPPYQGGGEMIDVVHPDESTWAELPHKFEAGTPNVGGAVGMAAAVEFLESLDAGAVSAHESRLVAYGLERLRRVDGLRLFGPPDPADRIAVFSFALAGVHPHDVATILDAEGIAVRAGHHCTQPLMRRLGVPATTRASCWVYSTTGDLDRLAESLGKAREMFG